jgi:prepilin-type N-terminal cleavage/methylation domain-containing protein/prepilin-type processing-associated H-X9-DG protein
MVRNRGLGFIRKAFMMNIRLFNRGRPLKADGGGGFTLIELLVVIAIIALLLAVVMPALRKAKELAKQVTCAAHQRGFGYAFLSYLEDNEGKSHWGPNYGLWYKVGLSGEMFDKDDGSAYWGIAYYPYAEDMDVFHCPSARRVDDWYDINNQPLFNWCHFGLNTYISNRITPGIKLHAEMIILQDHVEQKLDNNGDLFLIRPGEGVNLPQWRFELRFDYPESIPECFRHGRSSWAVSPTHPYEPMGTGKSNNLWLDGHVSSISQTTGEDVQIRWYTGGDYDPAESRWTDASTEPD